MTRTDSEKEILVNLGARIKQLRILKNLSQSKVALLMNSEKTNVSRLEAGNTNPTFLTLKKIANILKVQLAELVM